jgi:UDP-N-acetylglucosamine acyltransferase
MSETTLGAERRTETEIHPSAIVHAEAELGVGVSVGPWSILGPGVQVGDGTTIGPSVLIERDTRVGKDCRIHKSAVLGNDPQDLKYAGEKTFLTVGDRTVIREFATLNRGTAAEGKTVVGNDCLLMSYTHVAHDCRLGDHVVIANAVNMAGHVQIGDWANVGGVTPIHQFVRIGTHAFIGGGSRVAKDVPPYCKAAGQPCRLYGLNSVGLDRRGVPEEARAALKRAYRLLFQSKFNVTQGVDHAEKELGDVEEVRTLLEFIRKSERGITV